MTATGVRHSSSGGSMFRPDRREAPLTEMYSGVTPRIEAFT